MIYEKIQEYCDRHHISIRQFEMNCGFANGTISNWKNGTNKPSLTSLQSLAKVTKIPLRKWLKWWNEDVK